MPNSSHTEKNCIVCGKSARETKLLTSPIISDSIEVLIKNDYPAWGEETAICFDDLETYRNRRVQAILETEKGELSRLEKEVLASLAQEELLSKNINEEYDQNSTFGERIADKIAEFGGSWRFIIGFGVFLAFWVLVNVGLLLFRAFDPYPFIFLNLMLSCLAAIQAPIIMMSQNRQEAKDRLRAEHDYRVNLKAELEIRNLHEKVDHLLMNQWQKLLEIQQIQIEMIEDLAGKVNRK